jgi:hypothetical protein
MSQTERVVRYLREHDGATILEITKGLDPFVANPRARISDARKAGHDIVCIRGEDNQLHYYLDIKARLTLFRELDRAS